MAYQGRKVFQAGEVLTASDLNSTVDQTVMVFADTTARDTAIPTPSEGMIVYLESDNSILKYDGSQWTNIQLDIDLTADRVVVSDGSGDLSVSGVTTSELNILDGATISTTELNRLDNVSSNIQTQLNNKQPDVITTRGDLVVGNSSGNPARLGRGSSGQYLSSNGTDLVWDNISAGGMTLLIDADMGGSSFFIVSNISQSHEKLMIMISNVNAVGEVRVNFRNGTTSQSQESLFMNANDNIRQTRGTFLNLRAPSTTAAEPMGFTVILDNYSANGQTKPFFGYGFNYAGTASAIFTSGMLEKNTMPINSIGMQLSTGTYASGSRIKIYGMS